MLPFQNAYLMIGEVYHFRPGFLLIRVFIVALGLTILAGNHAMVRFLLLPSVHMSLVLV
jgi:hypothetical protein